MYLMTHHHLNPIHDFAVSVDAQKLNHLSIKFVLHARTDFIVPLIVKKRTGKKDIKRNVSNFRILNESVINQINNKKMKSDWKRI